MLTTKVRNGNPFSACLNIAKIFVSVNRDFFIVKSPLGSFSEVLLIKATTFLGDYRCAPSGVTSDGLGEAFDKKIRLREQAFSEP